MGNYVFKNHFWCKGVCVVKYTSLPTLQGVASVCTSVASLPCTQKAASHETDNSLQGKRSIAYSQNMFY